jgi:zinc transport system substrate-binding protein
MKKNILIGGVVITLLILSISAAFLLQKNQKKQDQVANTTNTQTQAPTQNKLNIATSFYPLEFLAKNIAGDKAEVFNPVPAGSDAHDFEPTAQDIQKIKDSKLFLYQGSGFDTWAEKASTETKSKIVASDLVEKLKSDEDLKHEDELGVKEEEHSEFDPHTWLIPKNMLAVAEKVEAKLSELDPQNTSTYKQNANNLKAKLQKLDADFTTGLSKCAKDTIVVSHNAFSYLAANYKFKVEHLAGLEPSDEPTVQEMTDIVELIKSKNLPVVFYETTLSPELAKTIAQETKAKTLVLYSLESINEEQKTQKQDYFSLMTTNLQNLQIGLECSK